MLGVLVGDTGGTAVDGVSEGYCEGGHDGTMDGAVVGTKLGLILGANDREGSLVG